LHGSFTISQPFCGALGLSQGGCFAMLLAAIKCNAIERNEEDPFPSLKFVINVAGFIPRAENMRKYFERPLNFPSLHVIGKINMISAG
jgi:hypothetical protein